MSASTPSCWVAVSGSWRNSCLRLRCDLQAEVLRALAAGKGIVSGGALGVDLQASWLALAAAPDGSRLRVILPTPLNVYAAHYQRRQGEGVISAAQCQGLLAQLQTVAAVDALHELRATVVDKTSYYARNTAVLDAADELLAFAVNASAGTQDTIDKARGRGMAVRAFSYTV